jgi:hypothetical protein
MNGKDKKRKRKDRNVNEKETYPRLTDHWMAENITDKPSTG